MMTAKRTGVNVALLFYVFLVLVRVLDNDLLGSWETAHISGGLGGSWIWVAVKFSYWCVPILLYCSLKGRLGTYLDEKFGFHLTWSSALVLIPLWFLVLLLEDHLAIPARDLTYSHLVTSVVTTPIIEEFVFRGFILDRLKEGLSFGRANLYQAILFSGVHLPYYYELDRLGNVRLLVGNLLYLAVFAYASGYLAQRTKSLYPSIVLHAINNLLT
jgi:membrane protease YdiL (CAAX protease family)